MMKNNFWRLWAKSLGEKASEDDAEADNIAILRTLLVVLNTLTCIFIMLSVIRHW